MAKTFIKITREFGYIAFIPFFNEMANGLLVEIDKTGRISRYRSFLKGYFNGPICRFNINGILCFIELHFEDEKGIVISSFSSKGELLDGD
jgi:hypothetical protein